MAKLKLDAPIPIDEIQKAIRKVKCKKATGIDRIPAEFYKHGCNELLSALVLMFNTIITNGEYPSSWATGIIHLKMMNAMIMIPFKPSFEVTPGQLIIYLYYMPL